MASNAENVSIWWRHHAIHFYQGFWTCGNQFRGIWMKIPQFSNTRKLIWKCRQQNNDHFVGNIFRLLLMDNITENITTVSWLWHWWLLKQQFVVSTVALMTRSYWRDFQWKKQNEKGSWYEPYSLFARWEVSIEECKLMYLYWGYAKNIRLYLTFLSHWFDGHMTFMMT